MYFFITKDQFPTVLPTNILDINENLDFNFTSQMQADSAGRALSSLISKMIKNKGFPYSVYSMLYQACVCSVSLYGSEVFGFSKFESVYNLHLRAIRAFLGLPKNTASSGLASEFDWLMPQYQSHIKMVQFFNRVLSTSNSRILKHVYQWDYALNKSGKIKTWSSEVKTILHENDLGYIFDSQQIFPTNIVTNQLKVSLIRKQQEQVKLECENKPKLRTFLKIKEFDKTSPHIFKHKVGASIIVNLGKFFGNFGKNL